jgi:hypothetical protein
MSRDPAFRKIVADLSAKEARAEQRAAAREAAASPPLVE